MNTKIETTVFKQARALAAIAVAATLSTSALADSDGHMQKIQNGGDAKVVLASNASSSIASPKASLYTRLGGYDGIAAVINETMPRLMADQKLGRFWANRGADGIQREKQSIIDFIANQAGGPVNYGGRDMVTAHKGMKISDADWTIFMGHLNKTLEKFKVPSQEKADVVNFMESLRATMVE